MITNNNYRFGKVRLISIYEQLLNSINLCNQSSSLLFWELNFIAWSKIWRGYIISIQRSQNNVIHVFINRSCQTGKRYTASQLFQIGIEAFVNYVRKIEQYTLCLYTRFGQMLKVWLNFWHYMLSLTLTHNVNPVFVL